MSAEQKTLAEIRKVIDELPEAQRLASLRTAQQLREFIAQVGGPGLMALVLVCAEQAV